MAAAEPGAALLQDAEGLGSHPHSQSCTCSCGGEGTERGGGQGPAGCYLLKGLLSSVGSDVVVEGSGSGKGSTAVAALEGSVTGVCDDVVPQL